MLDQWNTGCILMLRDIRGWQLRKIGYLASIFNTILKETRHWKCSHNITYTAANRIGDISVPWTKQLTQIRYWLQQFGGWSSVRDWLIDWFERKEKKVTKRDCILQESLLQTPSTPPIHRIHPNLSPFAFATSLLPHLLETCASGTAASTKPGNSK